MLKHDQIPQITVWHNPRCSKSRTAIELLKVRAQVTERRYLTDPPSLDELRTVLAQLGRPAIEMVRTKESAFRAAGLSKDSSEEDLLAAMAAHPELIERPIAIRGTRAILGRPPESTLALLD